MTKKQQIAKPDAAAAEETAVVETAVEETTGEAVEVAEAQAPPQEDTPAEEPQPKPQTTITADRRELLTAVKMAGRAIPGRSSLPILEHICFHADGVGSLIVEGTDLERSVSVPVPGWVNVGASFTAHYPTLTKILSAITNKVVEVVVSDGKTWEIKAGTDVYELEGLPAEEYPIAPPFTPVASFTMPARRLRTVLKRTLSCVSNDETRRPLMGVFFKKVDDKLHIAATDSHRLAFHESVTDVTGDLEAILPATALTDVVNLLEKAEDDIVFKFGDGFAVIEIGALTVRTRRIDGMFPNSYTRVIPTECNHRVYVDREALLSAVKKNSLIAKDDQSRVTLKVTERNIEVSAETGANRARVRTNVSALLEGAEITMAVNYHYLAEVLASADTRQVQLDLMGPLNAMKVIPVEGQSDFLFLVMPMQVREEKAAEPAQETPAQAEEEKVPAEAAA